MPSTKNFRILAGRALARPGAPERVAKARDEALAELGLQELRATQELSQVELAGRLQVTQPAISKLEHAEDVRLSTLRQYVEALGGELEVRARFGGAVYPIGMPAPSRRVAE